MKGVKLGLGWRWDGGEAVFEWVGVYLDCLGLAEGGYRNPYD